MFKFIFKEFYDSNMKELQKDFESIKGLIPFIVILGFVYCINYFLGN